MARARLEATVGLKTGAFRRGLAKLTRLSRNAARGISGAFAMGRNVFFGIVAGLTAISIAGAKAVKVFVQQREALAKLAAVQKATGFASGFTTGELDDQSKALSKLTGISKESINQTQAILATFKNVKGKEFEDATTAILDMSVVLGQDAKQGAIQLGKALNDPILGITALRRVGVSFTEQQKEQIKVLTESGRITKAQAIILKELKSEFGGSAEAVNQVDSGLANLKESFSQAIGALGGGIATTDEFKSAVETLTNAIDNLVESGALQLWAEGVISSIKAILPIAAKLRDMFGFVKGSVQKAAAFAGAFTGHTGTLKERIEAGKKAALSVEDVMAKARAKKLKEIQDERNARRSKQDKQDREIMRQQGPVQAAVSPLAEEKRRFSSLRRIGANIISGASGGENVQKKQLSALEQGLKNQQEMIKGLKERATSRGVF